MVSLLLLLLLLVGSDPQYHIETHREKPLRLVDGGSQNDSIQYILNQGFWEAVYNRGRFIVVLYFFGSVFFCKTKPPEILQQGESQFQRVFPGDGEKP